MLKQKWLFLILMIVFATGVLAGCPARTPQQPAPQQPQPPVDQQGEFNISTLIDQWANSDHANIQLSPAERDNCVVCHDGGAFARQLTTQAELEREFNVAIDCRTCHTGRGIELMQAGTIDIPTQENVQAGLGALCLSCHNERKVPNIDERSAPHGSSQGGVFTGSGGIRVADFNYGNSPHQGIQNTCISCHMPAEGESGLPIHTFRVENPQAVCGTCHGTITDVNRQAKADYDGDGNAMGFQDEVAGLLNLLEVAITKAIDGGSFETGGGQIVFKDAAGKETEVPNEVYQAAYNHVLVSNDGSGGVHNPVFVIQLLQQSYKALTGEDVPNATIR